MTAFGSNFVLLKKNKHTFINQIHLPLLCLLLKMKA